jgi:hypothetical protein
MPVAKGLGLTPGAVKGFSCMQQYRFLTIPQFARIANVTYDYAARVLGEMERRRVLGYFGYTSIPGQGRTPKVYYLKRRGYEYLVSESEGDALEIGAFHDVHKEFSWTPQMYHRLRLLDCFIALEIAVRDRPHLELIKTFLEYRRIKGTHARETTDYVAAPPISENRIVPDGAFVLGNRDTGRRGLFFLEMDMGTERITAPGSADQRATIKGKFEQYDRYLTSGRFVQTYETLGDFRFFVLLFVTTLPERIDNIRQAVANLSQNLHQYSHLATLEAAQADFVGPVWKSRDLKDSLLHALVG